MELHLPHIVVLLSLVVVASQAALLGLGSAQNSNAQSSQRDSTFKLRLYWESVLPKTPMPKAVKDLLRSDLDDEKSTYVGVGKGGVDVNAGKGKPGGTSANVGKGGVGVNTGQPGKRTSVGVGKRGVTVSTGAPKGKLVYVGVKRRKSIFVYHYAATENQLHDDPNVAFFFLEKDLYPGKKMDLNFGDENHNTATFLPRQEANTIPFSSAKLPEIYNYFSVKPGTLEAQIMKNTIKECEGPGIEGEEKYCATSLESMVDFATSKLGKEVQALSTEAETKPQKQEYTILKGVKKLSGEKAVACHKENYAYVVFYCHSTQATRAYTVPLKGADGSEAKAVAVCHTDTSKWNPKHVAFQVLKVKPGTVPICHFLPQDHVVWVQN